MCVPCMRRYKEKKNVTTKKKRKRCTSQNRKTPGGIGGEVWEGGEGRKLVKMKQANELRNG